MCTLQGGALLQHRLPEGALETAQAPVQQGMRAWQVHTYLFSRLPVQADVHAQQLPVQEDEEDVGNDGVMIVYGNSGCRLLKFMSASYYFDLIYVQYVHTFKFYASLSAQQHIVRSVARRGAILEWRRMRKLGI